ncbi:MAG: RNB domain-containing ribonuclease [Deltaproteobacteria bacterium]|jgi:exoribonuclease-2|nr:RNB domain-containing ribonuclease [Deltaproteobacteria bacterium]
MSNSVKYAAPGCIVELMQAGRAVQAWVLEEQSGQLRLWTINKREMKLPSSRLLPWIGPAYSGVPSRQEIQDRLEAHRKKREELVAGLDLDQVWELAQGEIRQAEAAWFAELVWPAPDVDQVAAMGQALLAQKTHFKFSPPVFEVYPAEQVELRQSKQEEEDRRMELATVGAEVFRNLYEAVKQRRVLTPEQSAALFSGPSSHGSQSGPDLAGRLQQLLLERVADPDAHDPDGLWKLLTKTLSAKSAAEDPHLPLCLAIAWGLLPEHHNFWLDRADYDPDPEWHCPWQAEIDQIKEAIDKFEKRAEQLETSRQTGQAELGDQLELPVFWNDFDLVSVDPDSTRDWDDAVGVERDGDGYRVCVALACPALVWPFGSDLDKAVLRRATSLYLPEAEHFMLPKPLALDLFGLNAGKLRPALLIKLRFSAEAELLDAEPALAWVRVRANLTQKQCEPLMSNGADNGADADWTESMFTQEQDEARSETALESCSTNPAAPFAGMLIAASELAGKLRKRRIESGAVITERPEIEILLNGSEVVVEPCPPLPFCQILVGELMVAATYALARWATERGVPLIYRSQDVVLPRDFAGIWRKEEEIAKVLKALPPSIFSLEAKPHAGLGLNFYSSFTAPLRRYPDLLNEAQVLGMLRDGHPPLSREELAALLPLVNSRLDSVGQSQRFRPRYWKLVYFQQQEQRSQKERGGLKYWDAVVTEENSHFVNIMVEQAQLYLRGPRRLFGERVQPGARVSVRLGKINPLYNEIQIMEVLEE